VVRDFSPRPPWPAIPSVFGRLVYYRFSSRLSLLASMSTPGLAALYAAEAVQESAWSAVITKIFQRILETPLSLQAQGSGGVFAGNGRIVSVNHLALAPDGDLPRASARKYAGTISGNSSFSNLRRLCLKFCKAGALHGSFKRVTHSNHFSYYLGFPRQSPRFRGANATNGWRLHQQTCPATG